MYEPGDIIGGYRLMKSCGRGAFGEVFLAENETTRQRFAVKILPMGRQGCENELAALMAYQEKCRYASLMRIYHIGRDEDCLFYVMDAADNLGGGEYLPDTLGNRLRLKKRLAPETLRGMLDDLLNGLEVLHGAGLLHRDIKPDNILWVAGRAVLGDIGLVTEMDAASFAGTRGFISPAVWRGERKFAARDDIYALAVTLYCALTGNGPGEDWKLPLSLSFSGCGDLIRAYNAVLEDGSAVCSVADFRAVLRKKTDKPVKTRRRISAAIWIVAAGIALCVALLTVPWKRAAAPTGKQPTDEALYPGERVLALRRPMAEQRALDEVKETLFEELCAQYAALAKQVEAEAPTAATVAENLNLMIDWYIRHCGDYENTPVSDESIYRECEEIMERRETGREWRNAGIMLDFEMRYAVGSDLRRLQEEQRALEEAEQAERDELLRTLRLGHQTRYAAYQKLSPGKRAVFDYASARFKADLLRQDFSKITYMEWDRSPDKMRKLYEEWVAAYRALKPLEERLLPVFDPGELD